MVGPEGQRFLQEINLLAAGSPPRFPRMFSYGLANLLIKRRTDFTSPAAVSPGSLPNKVTVPIYAVMRADFGKLMQEAASSEPMSVTMSPTYS